MGIACYGERDKASGRSLGSPETSMATRCDNVVWERLGSRHLWRTEPLRDTAADGRFRAGYPEQASPPTCALSQVCAFTGIDAIECTIEKTGRGDGADHFAR